MTVVVAETLPVRIKIGPTAVESSIEIDGVDMSRYVRGFTLHGTVGDVTSLTVDFIKIDVTAEGLIETTAVGDLFKDYRAAKTVKEGETTW